MIHDPQAIKDLHPATGYRIETRGLPLSDGFFPGLSLERMFIKAHLVDGITFLEFQTANGSRQVIDAAAIERVVPLGRSAMLADTLRQPERAKT